jgi:type I restriction enzyme S subunit
VKDFRGNDPKFISYFLQTLDLPSFNDKTSVPGINRNHLHELKIAIPPREEQRQIATQLGAMDAKLAAEETRRDALDVLFQSLLHHLMTGKVRIPGLELTSMKEDTL